MATIQDTPVYKDVFRLANLLLDNLENMPMKHRRTLGDRILDAAYDALTQLHFAYASKSPQERVLYLDGFQTRISLLKTYLRITNERRLIPAKQAVSIFELVADISKQIGGWRKSTAANIVPEA